VDSNATVLWTPSESAIADANITRFRDYFRRNFLISLGQSPADLHRASIQYPDSFWEAVWRFSAVTGELGKTAFEPGSSMLEGKWFPDSKLNFAESILKPDKLTDLAFAESIAVVTINETGVRTELTRKQLLEQVCQIARFLQAQGVQPGDRVVAVIPNIAEAVVGLLATVAIGAIWSSCSPDFGEDAIYDRFSQIEPKVILTVAECCYNRKSIQPVNKVADLLARLPTIRSMLVVGKSSKLETAVKQFEWASIMGDSSDRFDFVRFPFNQPLCILYSSGTTGIPKCIVHGAGGSLLQHIKEHSLHCDLCPGDKLFYYTTTGWMMWNWLVSGLASEAAIVLYDGSPFALGPDTLWKIAESEGITHFGASPRYYMTLEKEGYEPAKHHRLEKLRYVLSTGSPLLPESFDWIYRAISPRICLASISGGTDILSCFVLGNPTLPVVRGEIQCKGLGMDVRVFNEQGKAIIGAPGELVCVAPFPSMPICFWNDPNGKKYKSAYFERFEGVWCHGDWAQENSNGGFVIFGRSDATLNPSGVRIGTAEIYQQVEAFPEIAECLATVLKRDGDEQIALFVRMASGQRLSGETRSAICQRLKERCSPRHVPRFIVEAPDLPRTVSGKLSEIAVRSAINGSNLGNSGALANAECLQFFREWVPGE
jgi:acetoacetyl-CoA synthetase